MKNNVAIAIFFSLLLVVVVLVAIFSGRGEHDPKDLSYWMRTRAAKDWSSEAAQGEPLGQFHFGLTLIRTNFITMIDRVPRLSAIPLIGKRFFEKVTYRIDNNISQEQLTEAYRWIKESADQGFAPAKEAEKLFIGRIVGPKDGAANRSQPIRSETNRTSSAAGSRR